MTTEKVVTATDGQGRQFVQMVRDKKMSRARLQTALDDGTLGRVLDGIEAGLPITIGLPLIPPPGARIHTIRVRFNKGRKWSEALNAAGPNTPLDYNVRKVGDQYPPGEGVEEEEEIILLNFPRGGNWSKAIAWAEQFGLERTDPREVFAIGEHYPTLHRELGLDPMYVVATKECFFVGVRLACRVWWGDSGRGARLCWLEVCGRSGDWFAFRRKLRPQA